MFTRPAFHEKIFFFNFCFRMCKIDFQGKQKKNESKKTFGLKIFSFCFRLKFFNDQSFFDFSFYRENQFTSFPNLHTKIESEKYFYHIEICDLRFEYLAG